MYKNKNICLNILTFSTSIPHKAFDLKKNLPKDGYGPISATF